MIENSLMLHEFERFIELPPELRDLIYREAIDGTSRLAAVTVGAARFTDSCPKPNSCPHATLVDGLSDFYVPMIRPGYCAELLSISNPTRVKVDTAIEFTGPFSCCFSSYPQHEWYPPTRALSLTCKGVKEDMNHYLRLRASHRSSRETSLFVSYPHGLSVLRSYGRGLLRQTRSLHIAGTYTSISHKGRTEISQDPAPAAVAAMQKSAEELEHLVRSTLGAKPTYPIDKFELRMYFPGTNSYPCVWADINSPICIVLGSISGGLVDIECHRGRHGTAVYMTIRPNPNGRIISTVWRKLREGEGDGGQPEGGDWILDPKWPEWDLEYARSRMETTIE